MLQNLIDTKRFTFAPPLAWATAIAATLSVFALIVILINYAPLNRDAERRVEIQLPPATYETIGALIKATGNECRRICAVSAGTSLTPTHAVEVDCATGDSATACRTPIRYRINVEPDEGPKR